MHRIVDRAAELDKTAELSSVMQAWYRHNVDAHGFVAGGEIGPVTPEDPDAP
jgi:hypothetical protein